ncbi:MAG: TolC family protein, partial [Bacteroidota bacterium]
MKKYILYSIIFWYGMFVTQGQEVVLSFKEYLGYVKKYHPVAKQAELTISKGEATVMKARGGFDPKLQVAYDRKEFKGSEYYDLWNATFKIPTWYGVAIKGGFEQNEGVFLNPQHTVPEDGLFNAGLAVSLGKGLWINDRMATLQKAKAFKQQTLADRDLLINTILYEAAVTYFSWVKSYREKEVFKDFVTNAKTRLEGVKKSALAGDKAIIDTVEARIAYQNRRLSLEQANVKWMKSSLQLSNFLWQEENIPIEIQPQVIPDPL